MRKFYLSYETRGLLDESLLSIRLLFRCNNLLLQELVMRGGGMNIEQNCYNFPYHLRILFNCIFQCFSYISLSLLGIF